MGRRMTKEQCAFVPVSLLRQVTAQPIKYRLLREDSMTTAGYFVPIEIAEMLMIMERGSCFSNCRVDGFMNVLADSSLITGCYIDASRYANARAVVTFMPESRNIMMTHLHFVGNGQNSAIQLEKPNAYT